MEGGKISNKVIIKNLEMVSEYFLQKYLNFIPYIQTKNGRTQVDKTQYVRNLASLNDIVSLFKYFPKLQKNLSVKIIKNSQYYIELYKTKPDAMRQASAFLMILLSQIDPDNSVINKIYQNLINNLDNLEPRFELGEVLMALCMVNKNNKVTKKNSAKYKIISKQEKMLIDLQDKYYTLSKDDIFEYNWHAQFLNALVKNKLVTSLNTRARRETLVHHVNLLEKYILTIIDKYFNDVINTNYLAVAFESLTALHELNVLLKIKSKYNIYENIINLLKKLNTRRNKTTGLYMFTDGNSRIDITGHMIHGFHHLLDI